MTEAYKWRAALSALVRWHDEQDAAAASEALEFVEPRIRVMIPPLVRRTWGESEVDDAIADFLERLLLRRLPTEVDNPPAYITRSLRNHFLDLNRRRRRAPTLGETDVSEWHWPATEQPSALSVTIGRREAEQLAAAMERLSVADRVALKLDAAPEWLDFEELSWLSQRAGLERDELLTGIDTAQDVYALTLIYDPGPSTANDTVARRKRMERFRRRRSRARVALKALMESSDG